MNSGKEERRGENKPRCKQTKCDVSSGMHHMTNPSRPSPGFTYSKWQKLGVEAWERGYMYDSLTQLVIWLTSWWSHEGHTAITWLSRWLCTHNSADGHMTHYFHRCRVPLPPEVRNTSLFWGRCRTHHSVLALCTWMQRREVGGVNHTPLSLLPGIQHAQLELANQRFYSILRH